MAVLFSKTDSGDDGAHEKTHPIIPANHSLPKDFTGYFTQAI